MTISEPASFSPGPGRHPAVSGVVRHGVARGRTLGFPTANLVVPRAGLPEPGVYGGWVQVDDEGARRPAMIYVGSAPTFGDGEWRLEAHLLDFDGDLYGRRLTMRIAVRIAGERTHASAADLAKRLERLESATRAALGAPRRRLPCGPKPVMPASEES